MKCANCTAEIKDGSVYCSVCGKEAQMIDGYLSLEEDFLYSLLQEGIQPFFVKSKKGLSIEAQKKLKKRRRKTILLLSCLIMIILLVIAVNVKLVIDYRNNNSYEYQWQKAEDEFEMQNYDKALLYYTRALSIVPDDTQTRLKMAEIYQQKKEYSSAVVLLTEAIRIDKNLTEAYVDLISIYKERGQYTEIQKLIKYTEDEKVSEQFAEYEVSAPVIYPDEDTFYEELDIMIISVDKDDIYYTIDGSDPITNGIYYQNGVGIHFGGSGLYTVRAVCKNEMNIYSEVIEKEYQVALTEETENTETENAGTENMEIEMPAEEMIE